MKESKEKFTSKEKPFNPEKDITDEDWQGMKNKVEKCRKDNGLLWCRSLAANMKILNPELDFNITEEEVSGMKAEIEEDLKEYRKDGDWRDWSRVESQIVGMKILGLEPDVDITEKDWQTMKADLERFRNYGKTEDRWEPFSSKAKTMTILAADKVEVNENGLKVE